MGSISLEMIRDYFAEADDDNLSEFVDLADLRTLIVELEGEDFFGTEGFEKRFA